MYGSEWRRPLTPVAARSLPLRLGFLGGQQSTSVSFTLATHDSRVVLGAAPSSQQTVATSSAGAGWPENARAAVEREDR